MTGPGRIEFREAPRPRPGPGEVLLRIRHIGVCGSDVHVFGGRHPFTTYPVIQGHECSGRVAELGEGVAGFAPGDPVTFVPQLVCGRCAGCRRGDYHICEELKVYGFQTDGAAREYFPISADNLVLLPEGVSLVQGAMVEPLAVGVHAALRLASGARGRNVVVLGAGTIGNAAAQAAAAAGANVVVTDIDPFKLEIARRCGLTGTVNVAQEDLAARLRELLPGGEADAFIECVGSQETINQAVRLVRKGGQVVVVGVFGMGVPLDLGLVQNREISMVGSLMYKKEDFLAAVSCIAEGRCRLDPLVTHHFAFEDFALAYELITGGRERCAKVMIDL